MDYDLHISFMGNDMGITPIRLHQSGQYELCDACYGLSDALGHVGHDEFMTRIFQALHGTGEHGAMNDDAATSGSFDGLQWHIVESSDSTD
jgi:hypothetical protein